MNLSILKNMLFFVVFYLTLKNGIELKTLPLLFLIDDKFELFFETEISTKKCKAVYRRLTNYNI